MTNTHWQGKRFALVLIWLLFTASLAGWWWIYGLQELHAHPASPEEILRKQWMIFWEGLILVLMILGAGGALLYLLYQDHKRHLRLKHFFSTFTHDIKTSISRMSLQTQILTEGESAPTLKQLQNLLESHQRLDLQLENALLFTQSDDSLRTDIYPFSKILQSIRMDFPELTIKLDRDVQLIGDERVMMMVVRNIFQNAVLHGNATEIIISTKNSSTPHRTRLHFQDNGTGFSGNMSSLGNEPLQFEKKDSNGLGLFLVRTMCERMQGQADFSSSNKGFTVLLELPTLKENS